MSPELLILFGTFVVLLLIGTPIAFCLGAASLAHFEAVQAILKANGVPYRINPRLVRGMDYYNLTVFEFITDHLGAQGTVCGGGRYDYLIEQIGGKPAPAVGWALGVERVLELLQVQGQELPAPVLDAYAIGGEASAWPQVLLALQTLRTLGLRVQMHSATGEGLASIKSQFKKADASGARYALVFGPDELRTGCVTVKSLRASNSDAGVQTTQPLDNIAAWAQTLQSHLDTPAR